MIQLLVAFGVSNGRQSSGIFKNSLKRACLIDVLIFVLVLSSSLPWLDELGGQSVAKVWSSIRVFSTQQKVLEVYSSSFRNRYSWDFVFPVIFYNLSNVCIGVSIIIPCVA